ncbi:hypothetical protein DL769_002096 [Monosporascus sp. CRB-8-3]|nr:hypothetical protein DL769_002096 [Monosporascus sp. CRB-8-3]
MNDTSCPVNIPGYSHHGNCNLLCAPASWSDVLIFFLANYAAHAATVVTLPGESPFDTIRGMIIALVFPSSGVIKAIRVIATGAQTAPTTLRAAARAGALCIVIKESEIKHERGEPLDSNFLKFLEALIVKTETDSNDMDRRNPENSVGRGTELGDQPPLSDKAEKGTRSTGRRDEEHRIESDPELAAQPEFRAQRELRPIMAEKVHGLQTLPVGYTLVVLYPDAEFEIDPQLDSTWPLSLVKVPSGPRFVLASNYNVLKILASIVQLLFGMSTLYRARGDQVDRFGYVAFGLTVAPYAWMSLLNLVGNLVSPQYPAKFLVGQKAKSRMDDVIQ